MQTAWKSLTLVGVGLLLMPGCAPTGNHALIHGEVRLDGKLLPLGSILFIPTDGTVGVAAGAQIKDGWYRIDSAKGPAVGRNVVQIQAVRGSGKMAPNPLRPDGPPVEVFEGAIPARFNTASTLSVEVRAQDNVADFAVESR